MPEGNALTFRTVPTYAVLGAVLLLALALRLVGIDWGLPSASHPDYSYHPDEAFTLIWARWLVEGQIIPKHFIYGGTFYYTILNAFIFFARGWGESLAGINLLADAILVGRYFMVAVALLSILLIYECGRLLYDRATALLAALLLAVSPSHVIWAQQTRPDEIAVLFVLLALYLAARILWTESLSARRAFVYLGVLAGMTLAFRFPLAVVCIMPLTAMALRRERFVAHGAVLPKNLALAALTTLLTYAIASPHTFIYHQAVLQGLAVTYGYETSVFVDAVGNGPLPYQHLVLSLPQATGYGGYLLALAGLAYAIWKRREADKVIVAGIAGYAALLVLVSWVVVRYTLPLVPLLTLLSAAFVTDVARRSTRTAAAPAVVRPAVVAVAGIVVLWSLAATLAFVRMQASTNSRDVTAAWIETNVPAGARILMVKSYLGDDFFNPVLSNRYRVEYFVLSEDQDSARLLRERPYDYIVLQEPVYANMERLGERHPLKQSGIFYEGLHRRGYALQREFKQPVQFAGIDFSHTFRSLDYVVVNPGMRVYRNPGTAKAGA
jgi:4-amino-4-deoxy-L-arabinose transferase-like glycosyltransferase